MKSYRLYLLNRDDRISDAMEGLFADDDEALAQAEAARNGYYAVEVWHGARLVARLGEEFLLGRG